MKPYLSLQETGVPATTMPCCKQLFIRSWWVRAPNYNFSLCFWISRQEQGSAISFFLFSPFLLCAKISFCCLRLSFHHCQGTVAAVLSRSWFQSLSFLAYSSFTINQIQSLLHILTSLGPPELCTDSYYNSTSHSISCSCLHCIKYWILESYSV